jgi:hypothetical protein
LVLALALIIVSILLLLAGGQLLNFTIGVDYILVANAQSNDSANILVPSNMSKIEINLKNSKSDNANSTYVQLITGLSSAGAAIAGGFIGSWLTGRSNRQMEDKRYEREGKREKEIQEQEEKLKDEHRDRLMRSTFYELRDISATLDNLEDKDFWAREEKYNLIMLESRIKTFSLDFLRTPHDIRLALFPPDVLWDVQSAYVMFEAFANALIPFIMEYNVNPTGDFVNAVKPLGSTEIKRIVDIAISHLKNLLPDL